jgi:hypothetical protein
MAKGNGANGAPKPPGWWQAAKDELKSEILSALDPRFQSIEAKLVIMDMKIDALDRRVTRLEERVDGIEARS